MKLFAIEVVRCLEDDLSTSDFPSGSDAIISVTRNGTRLNHLLCGIVRSVQMTSRAKPGFDLPDGHIAIVDDKFAAKVDGKWPEAALHWEIILEGRALTEADDGVPYPVKVGERVAKTSSDRQGRYEVWKVSPAKYETRAPSQAPMGRFESFEEADALAQSMADAYDTRTERGPGLHTLAVKKAPTFSDGQKAALKAILAKRAVCDRFLRFAESSRARTISPDRMTASGVIGQEDVTVELPLDVIQAALDDGSLERIAREWLASIDVAVEATYGIAITPSEA